MASRQLALNGNASLIGVFLVSFDLVFVCMCLFLFGCCLGFFVLSLG